MKKVKKSKILLIIFLTISVSLSSVTAQNIYVKEKSGTQTPYELSNIRKLTFSSGNLNVTKIDNATEVYSLSDLQYLSFFDMTTEIEEILTENNSLLKVYPNPVTDNIIINISNMNDYQGVVNILNIEGRVVKTIEANGSEVISLDLSQLSQGIYICRYISSNEAQTIKFIKQ